MRTDHLAVHPSVRAALGEGHPVVALESVVISHGLPWPDNLELARAMEAEVRSCGAVPATTALLGGRIHVGLEDRDLERLARTPGVLKISRRDLPVAMAQGRDGATTVAGAMIAAHWAGVRVLATGGIGGVHRGGLADVSADLPELARTPVLVVCAGAKMILDLPATLEWLETHGVPVVGYQTGEFPAFYSRESGLELEARADSPEEAAAIARALWGSGFTSGMLVCAPCPEEAARPQEEMETAIAQAAREAETQGVRGKAITPFLLRRIAEITGGKSLAANVALLRNNARVAARVAAALAAESQHAGRHEPGEGGAPDDPAVAAWGFNPRLGCFARQGELIHRRPRRQGQDGASGEAGQIHVGMVRGGGALPDSEYIVAPSGHWIR